MSYQELDLDAMYGPNFKGNFDPHMKNIREGTICEEKHHCLDCGKKPPTRKCYLPEKLHFAFCQATKKIDGKKVICGLRFQVNSPGGCSKHPYNYGQNLIFKENLRGKPLEREAKEGTRKLPEPEKKLEDKGAKHFSVYKQKAQQTAWKKKDEKVGRKPTKTKKPKLQPAPDHKTLQHKK